MKSSLLKRRNSCYKSKFGGDAENPPNMNSAKYEFLCQSAKTFFFLNAQILRIFL